MSRIKLNKAQMDRVLRTHSMETVTCEGLTFTVVDKSEWEQDFKDQLMDKIILVDEKHYFVPFSRQGSSFTDWYYGHESDKETECQEVRKVEVKTYKWVGVK